MEDIVYYFAYGSNLNPKRMEKRKAYFTERSLAKLPNYEFKLNKLEPDGSVTANICPSKNKNVYGALYTGKEETLITLDIYEDVATGEYTREKVLVELEDGKKIEATAYIATPETCSKTQRRVKKSYLDHILCGKDILPADYYKFIEGYKSCCDDE